MNKVEIDESKIIKDPNLKVNTSAEDRIGTDRIFIKTHYMSSRKTEDKKEKIMIVTKDEYENKYVNIIEEPKLIYHLTKPEYWNHQNSNYISKDKVIKLSCINKYKEYQITDTISKLYNDYDFKTEIERLMSSGLYEDYKTAQKLVQLDGRVHGSDINIEDQYIKLLLQKYPTTDEEGNSLLKSNRIRKGFFDIETDGRGINGVPDPEVAPAPINMITYFDDYTMTAFSYLLSYENEVESFDRFINNQNEIKKEILNQYKEKGLDIDLEIIICKTELELIARFLENINQKTTPDFLLA